uniref:Uncharacterized protein n=1 Tax=viral metagenome TaxID=1070528 RepID=A0A6C0HGA9_9ZZZZ
MKLTKKDYTSILKYYKINYENLTSLQIKNNAESILATKLCKCIKKVTPLITNESNAIAICTNSVLQKKYLKAFRFTCKKKAQFIAKKSRKNGIKLWKTKRRKTKN